MKTRMLMLLAVALAAGVAALASTGSAHAYTDGTILDYTDAVAAGIVPPLQQYTSDDDPAACVPTGGRTCTGSQMYCTTSSSGGDYATVAALQAAENTASQDATCTADPRAEYFGRFQTTGSTQPDAGSAGCFNHDNDYFQGHFVGYFANQCADGKFQGTRSTIETGSPSWWAYGEPNGCGISCAFLRSEVVAVSSAGNTTESGWQATSAAYGPNFGGPTVFTMNQRSDLTYFSYQITPGNYSDYRVRDLNNNATMSEIFWAGSWQRLSVNTWMHCRNTNGSNNCYPTVGQYVGDPNCLPHDLNVCVAPNANQDGHGVNFKTNMIRTGPNAWSNWTTNYGTEYGQSSPDGVPMFLYCAITNYTVFRVPRIGAC